MKEKKKNKIKRIKEEISEVIEKFREAEEYLSGRNPKKKKKYF